MVMLKSKTLAKVKVKVMLKWRKTPPRLKSKKTMVMIWKVKPRLMMMFNRKTTPKKTEIWRARLS